MAVATLTASLSACTDQREGLPTPGGSSSGTTRPSIPGGGGTSGTRTPSSGASPSGNPIRDVDTCALLNSADQATLGIEAGSPKSGQTDVDKGCIWDSKDVGEFGVQVNAYGDRGLKDVQSTGEVKQIPAVGKHNAVQYLYGKACAVSLAITESARVDATSSSGNDSQRACQIATQVAQMIEPKLPGS
ncbi:DUF3558 family protein [Kibdelosporangium philippinense]|uniref:DUF3558 family protein n=1 Tax=Kibdelosporangium philippinense TaxID=211113 RepID=UPI0035588E63